MHKYMKVAVYALLGGFALVGIVFTIVFVGMQFGFFNVRGANSDRNAFFLSGVDSSVAEKVAERSIPCDDETLTSCNWDATPQWEVVREGLIKDASIINRVSLETGVPARLIPTVVIPEQIRFFTAEREVFKRYFEPLKILGSLSQFSLGVSGIKQDTALQIEQYANDPSSPFYPGDAIAPLLAYPEGAVHDSALYERLTNEKDHYYSYLYTAVAIKEILAQWERASFPIGTNAGTVATLFNIGFEKSVPNNAPVTGGAPITVGGKTYTFGALGAEFYSSDELRDVFPH